MRPNEFSLITKKLALARQNNRCASCGTYIFCLGEAGRAEHQFDEAAQVHHIRHVKFGGSNDVENCVVLFQACHYSAHEGGNYRFGTVMGHESDFPHFRGDADI